MSNVTDDSPSNDNRCVKKSSYSSTSHLKIDDEKINNVLKENDNDNILKHRLKNNNTVRDDIDETSKHKYVVSEITININDLPIDYSISGAKNKLKEKKPDIIKWPLGETTDLKMQPLNKVNNKRRVFLIIIVILIILIIITIMIVSLVKILNSRGDT